MHKQLMSSKKANKKHKQQLKLLQEKFEHKKPHYEQYPYPPYCQKHLRALLLEYMALKQFEYPIHHLSMFSQIKNYYRGFQNIDIYVRDLNLKEILEELQMTGCIDISERALGTQLVFVVEKADLQKIMREASNYSQDRPLAAPPDPITFQQQKSEMSSKETNKKIESCLNIPSLFMKDEREPEYQSFEAKLILEEFNKQKNVEYCDHCTRERCKKAKSHANCNKKHFRAIINQNTDESYGNCPHLNACHNPDCKLIHYVEEDQHTEMILEKKINQERMENAEWVNCDLRYFDFKILGKFNVVMADPPWDIHMSLPYGTLKDKEMLNLRVDILQDEGLIFLWVTGRAMELGRECLAKWGYTKVDEVVWIKTNQIHRLIITGKTGHWLNHTKEHCLVGLKGNPNINRYLDCDVIVSKVRETSRKPDQVYAMIERMSPGGKKIELFGRPDNCMPGWLTLGNQLTDVRLKDRDIISRYQAAYPKHDLSDQKMLKNLEEMVNQDNLDKVYLNHIQKNSGTL